MNGTYVTAFNVYAEPCCDRCMLYAVIPQICYIAWFHVIVLLMPSYSSLRYSIFQIRKGKTEKKSDNSTQTRRRHILKKPLNENRKI